MSLDSMNSRSFEFQLNLHYDLPTEEWQKVARVFKSMEGYIDRTGCSEDYPSWFGEDGSEKFIALKVEASGFAISSRMNEGVWTAWITKLCARLSLALGKEVHITER